MKLKKTKGSVLNLKAGKSQWAKKISKEYGEDIPVMTSIPKDVKSAQVHFYCLARLVELAQALVYASPRFRTGSEVYRAAMYIGLSILYHLLGKKDGDLAKASQIYNVIQQQEDFHHWFQLLDASVSQFNILKKSCDLGMITQEEMSGEIEELLVELPPNIRKPVEEKLKRLLAGDKVSEIMETRSWGGKR